MSYLSRIVVDKFKIEDAISIETLELNKENKEFLNSHIITMEKIFEDLPKIILNSRKEELFLNGVMLTFDKNDGLYNIYSSNKEYVGLGIIKNKLLKRDIVC